MSPINYALFAYPNPSEADIHQRMREAMQLGIVFLDALSHRDLDMTLLGKGYCGVVLKGYWQDKHRDLIEVAIKVRRRDASKPNLQAEAMTLGTVNQRLIGPILYAHSDNFMVMEYLSGSNILTWLQREHSQKEVDKVLEKILRQAFHLDEIGLDHGNLRCVTEHILFRGDEPVLIDFSSASFQRRAANVTTLTQGLFWGTVLTEFITKFRSIPTKDSLIPLLRSYKQKASPQTFHRLLSKIFP